MDGDGYPTLDSAEIETRSILADDGVFTTLAFVTFDESGDRAFSFARKPGADTQLRWEEVDKSLIDEAKVFHFGTLSLTDEPVRTATQKAVAYAKAQGKLISCDPNLRLPLWPDADAAKEQMLWSLRQADVVKISDNEVEFLWNCTPEEGADKLLTEFGVSLAMVTLGPDGCLLKTRTAAFRAVCRKVHPVDTTGAGDAFFAGTVIGLTYGKTLAEACEIGSRLAASVICISENVCPRFRPQEFGLDAPVTD